MLAVAFTDELATGVVPAASPELAASFGLTASRAAGWTLVAFQVLGLVLEPPLLALARGRRARTLRAVGLWGMAAALLAAAVAPSYAMFLAALAVYGPASGLGTGLAQSALATWHPDRLESVLARWTLLGLLGDLAAPAAFAGLVAVGLGWRGALAAAAVLCVLQALAAARAPAGASEEPERGAEALAAALRTVASRPALLGWSAAVALCGLMDEILVSFGALWLSSTLHAGAGRRAAVLSAWVIGGIAGTALLERAAARFRPPVLLAISGVGCTGAYLAWLASRHWVASAVALGLAGLFAACHHPLLRARAFATSADRPEVVLAVGSAFTAVEVVLPLAVGLVADRAGLTAALLVLLLQPAGVLAAAAATRRGRGEPAVPAHRA